MENDKVLNDKDNVLQCIKEETEPLDARAVIDNIRKNKTELEHKLSGIVAEFERLNNVTISQLSMNHTFFDSSEKLRTIKITCEITI